jgi:hypothetical protein
MFWAQAMCAIKKNTEDIPMYLPLHLVIPVGTTQLISTSLLHMGQPASLDQKCRIITLREI